MFNSFNNFMYYIVITDVVLIVDLKQPEFDIRRVAI